MTMERFLNPPRLREVRDVGADGRFPMDTSCVIRLITAGAESRTVNNPRFLGQFALFTFQEDGGDCTLNFLGAINQAGNTRAVMDAVGDGLLLVAGAAGSIANPTLRWRIVMNDTCTLSTP